MSPVRIQVPLPLQFHRTRLCPIYGPVVKRLRHRPFTAVTRVRFPSGSPPFLLSRSYGGVAQPVEHLLHTQGVTDSSSVVSTIKNLKTDGFEVFYICSQQKYNSQQSHFNVDTAGNSFIQLKEQACPSALLIYVQWLAAHSPWRSSVGPQAWISCSG